MTELKRCGWGESDPLLMEYHDHQWGVPVYDDRVLFEMLSLEGAQAGLSWLTVLRKRQAYLEAFDNFDLHKVAAYDEAKVGELLANAGIIRNKGKITSVIDNARSILSIVAEYDSFKTYIWQFAGGRTVINRWASLAEIPAETEQSKAMSKDLKKRGFRFVGPTTCYAYMQATGMVNDHLVSCFRYKQVVG